MGRTLFLFALSFSFSYLLLNNITHASEIDRYRLPLATLTMCVDPHWAPYEYISDKGTHKGIAADLLKVISEKSHINFNLIITESWQQSIEYSKQGKCDVLSFLNKTHEREQWLDFTEPYFSDVNVILTRREHPNIVDLHAFNQELLVLPKGYMLSEKLKHDYPNLRITSVETEAEALKMVEEKFADITVRPLITTLAKINSGDTFFKIAGELPDYQNKLRIGLVKSQSKWLPLLNQAISEMSVYDVQFVLNKYNRIPFDEEVDYQYVYQLTLIIVFIFIICLVWIVHSRKNIAEIDKLKLIIKNEKVNRQYTTIQLDESESRYRKLIESAYEGIVVLTESKICFFNSSFQRMIGYSLKDCEHFPFIQFISPEYREEWLKMKNEDSRGNVRVQLQHQHGTKSWVEVHSVQIDWQKKHATLYFFHNVNDRVLYEQKIEYMAQHDILTNLPNRSLFTDRIEQSILLAERECYRLAVLFIDVDKFKSINDTYGHHIGDFVIKTVAQRISNTLRKSDSAARLGGDEFLVLLHQGQGSVDVAKVAEKVKEILQAPIFYDESLTLHVTASIGISIYPDHAHDVQTLIQKADDAMYRVKNVGGNGIEIYAPFNAQEEMNGTQTCRRFHWHSHYQSGHSGIDKEHQQLFDFANQLADSIEDAEAAPEEFQKQYHNLVKHIRTHFEHEEAILNRLNFNQLEQHKALHHSLLHKASELFDAVMCNQQKAQSLVEFLADELLTKHLLHEDSLFFSTLDTKK